MKTGSTNNKSTNSSLKISIVGSGNVATQFGKALKQNIVGITGRNQKETKKLSKTLNTKTLTYAEAVAESDVIILAVSDDAISKVVQEFKIVLESLKVEKLKGLKIVKPISFDSENILFVHTSGPVGIDIFKDFKNAAILYPLQSLTKKVDIDFLNVPLLIEATNKKCLNLISEIANKMSRSVYNYNSEQRAIIHLSAVFANNFTNHLNTLAYTLLEDHKIKPEVLLPLILQSAEKIKNYHPSGIQTGPAMRGDVNTMKKHLQLIKDDAYLKEVYSLLSKGITKKFAEST